MLYLFIYFCDEKGDKILLNNVIKKLYWNYELFGNLSGKFCRYYLLLIFWELNVGSLLLYWVFVIIVSLFLMINILKFCGWYW